MAVGKLKFGSRDCCRLWFPVIPDSLGDYLPQKQPFQVTTIKALGNAAEASYVTEPAYIPAEPKRPRTTATATLPRRPTGKLLRSVR